MLSHHSRVLTPNSTLLATTMTTSGYGSRDCTFLATPLRSEADARKPSRKDEEEERNTELVEVVPDGDALFKGGRDDAALDIRVSAAVVSPASPVFARMLSSSFIEGRSTSNVGGPAWHTQLRPFER